MIIKNLPTATRDGDNTEARSAMLHGSMMAGFAFANAVLGLVHSIAHRLSAHYDLMLCIEKATPHGRGFFNVLAATSAPSMADSGRIVFFPDVSGVSMPPCLCFGF